MSYCVQEEERLMQYRAESAYLASISKDKDKGKKGKMDKEAAGTAPYKKQQKKSIDPKGAGCFFCGAEGHKKKQCTNYQA